MTYPEAPLGVRIRIAPGADLTAHPITYPWQEIGDDWYTDAPIQLKRGGEDEEAETSSELSLTLRNSSPGRQGRYTTDNAQSDLWPNWDLGCPVELAVDAGTGWVVLAVQYLTGVYPSWPGNSATLSLVDIQAAGMIRRLQQGAEAMSALRRTIFALVLAGGVAAPVAWWPAEDGPDSTQVVSGIPGGPSLPLGGDARTGSSLLPPGAGGACLDLSRSGESGLYTRNVDVHGPTGISAGTAASWEVETVVGWSTLPGIGQPSWVSFEVPGSAWPRWGLYAATGDNINYYVGAWAYDGDTVFFELYDDNAAATLVKAGQVYHVRLALTQSGGDISASLYVDGALIITNTVAGTLYKPTEIWMPARGAGELSGPSGQYVDQPDCVSHTAIWTPVRGTAATYKAVTGYTGEMAHERIARLCAEERAPVTVNATRSAVMGPQPVEALVPLLRECETVDRGIIDDALGTISYRALSELYNRAPVLTVDGKGRQLFAPYAPVRDDLKTRNDMTVSRPDGSSARVQNAAHVQSRGRYSDSVELGVATDAQLPHQASWRVHEGTRDGMRYPTLTVDMLRAPDLIPGWLAARLGDRATVLNPPRQQAPDNVDLMLRGWTSTISGRRGGWVAVCNCLPWDTYEVFEVETGTGNRSRIPAGVSTLDATYQPTDTTLSVTSAAVRWIDSAAYPSQFPIRVAVSGEVMDVTAITGTGLTQTFTVQRGAHGFAKTLPAGSAVQLYRAPVIAL